MKALEPVHMCDDFVGSIWSTPQYGLGICVVLDVSGPDDGYPGGIRRWQMFWLSGMLKGKFDCASDMFFDHSMLVSKS